MSEQAPVFKDDGIEVYKIGSSVRIEGKDAAGRTRLILIVTAGRCISVAFIDPCSNCTTNIVWEEGTSEGG